MVTVELGRVRFSLAQPHCFAWLEAMGEVFAVFAESDSGNVCFGVDNHGERYFVKVAGLHTVAAACTPQQAIANLRQAAPLYEALAHPALIQLLKHYPLDDLYIAVFVWASGECLFDHWNFDHYRQNPLLLSPATRFIQLPVADRLATAELLFSFLLQVAHKGYHAVDFYDGSLMYDFATGQTTICDIDLFRKQPAVNDIGEDFWGSKRLKAPEEYCYGATLNEATNVFTLGALLFQFFGHYTEQEVALRYQKNAFAPCASAHWELNEGCYHVALTAVAAAPASRFATIDAFYTAWRQAVGQSVYK